MTSTEPVVLLDEADARDALVRDTLAGLSAPQKWLPPVWFYDERGGRLFDEITRLPEYYPTRAERRILEDHAADIVSAIGASTLVELGAGTSTKTRLLLDAMRDAGLLRAFVPLDVDVAALRSAAAEIETAYRIPVTPVVADFTQHLHGLPAGDRRLVAFLGGTIGNLEPSARAKFLFDIDASLLDGEGFLVGTDLVKDTGRLLAAYDDAAGVTAEFNRNVLHRLNRELGADFVPDRFEHVAVWDEAEAWIEMRLRSTADQVVTIEALALDVAFAEGEELRTEISAKFTPERVEAELWEAGLVVRDRWTDPAGDFLLTLASPYC